MLALLQLPLFWAADNRLFKLNLPNFGTASLQISSLTLIVLGLIAFSFVLGYWFAEAVRMKDYGWKVGLILASFSASLAICLLGQYKLGVDLQGGAILVYQVNEEETLQLDAKNRSSGWDMSKLVQVLSSRLNESGLKEIVVRPFGPKQIEIVVPEADPAEIEKLKRIIVEGGRLRFMIVASEIKDGPLFELARSRAQTLPAEHRADRPVLDESGNQVGFWARVGRQVSANNPESAPFRDFGVVAGLIRDARTGEIIDLTREEKQFFQSPGNFPAFQAFLTKRGIKQIDALMVFDADYEIKGETDLAYAIPGHDQSLRPAINFGMYRGESEFKMGNLTAQNIERKLAIIFDNELKSAPVIRDKISERGEITGDYTQDEVDFMVQLLKSGSLPVVLDKNPISDNTIGAILGMDTIVKGSWSVAMSLVVVVLFMIVYYRFAGFVAGSALTLNLLLTVAFMVLFQAPFTLPGLAGLVLTVGMSVDANVLIYERMREEQARGATLRMSIRNGFDKALSAIIDGNLTTLLTAVVLYAVGTDQVRGFGATLILGIVTSMFTAIFGARVVFDIAEKTRYLTQISMFKFLTEPTLDWCKYLVPAMVGSTVLIVIGLVATVARGKGIFDIDLAGGTSVTFILKEPMPDKDVRDKVDAVLSKVIDPVTKGAVSYSVHEVNVQIEKPETVYKVDSTLPEVKDLQAKLQEAFRTSDGKEGLRTFQMTPGPIEERALDTQPTIQSAGPAPAAKPAAAPPLKSNVSKPAATVPLPESKPEEKPAPTKPPEKPAEKQAEKSAEKPPSPDEGSGEAEESATLSCEDEPPAEANKDEQPAAEKPAVKPAAKPAETPAGEAKPATASPAEEKPAAKPPGELAAPAPVTPPATGAAAASAPPPAAVPQVESTVPLSFPQSAITADALRERIKASGIAALNFEPTVLQIDSPQWDHPDSGTYTQWNVKLVLSKAQTEKLLAHMQGQIEREIFWQTSSKIGGQVSEDTRWRAVGAILVSLLGILAYVWFRFLKAIWGIAAIVALAHDALVMLGGIAVSYWLVGALGWMQVEEFKISLPVVAAFLTLIGYSVNDTIVIFDRIREIRGKSPDITAKMINDSVNQTLSRTIITGGLTLMVVIVLYFFGGSGIHAFAFSLVVGVISGSYSTVFIAAPILLWLIGNKGKQPGKAAAREMARTTV